MVRPIAEIAPTLKRDNGLHVEFLQAIPVFSSELSFNKHHGAEALLQVLESKQVAFWDPRRAPEPV